MFDRHRTITMGKLACGSRVFIATLLFDSSMSTLSILASLEVSQALYM